jgi:hypothetical protein
MRIGTWLLPLAVGVPLLIVYWACRVRSREPAVPSRRRMLGSVLLGGFVGAVALTATLATAATIAELPGASHPLNVAYSLLGWTILGLELDVGVVVLVLYGVLLSLLISVVAVYYELVLPYLAPRGAPLLRQVAGLALLVLGFFGIVFLFSLLVEDAGSLGLWWRTGGPIMLLGAAVGVVVYASTALYSRALAITMTPTLRRDES